VPGYNLATLFPCYHFISQLVYGIRTIETKSHAGTTSGTLSWRRERGGGQGKCLFGLPQPRTDVVGLRLGYIGVPVSVIDAGCEDRTVAMTGVIHRQCIGQIVYEGELRTRVGIVALGRRNRLGTESKWID